MREYTTEFFSKILVGQNCFEEIVALRGKMIEVVYTDSALKAQVTRRGRLGLTVLAGFELNEKVWGPFSKSHTVPFSFLQSLRVLD